MSIFCRVLIILSIVCIVIVGCSKPVEENVEIAEPLPLIKDTFQNMIVDIVAEPGSLNLGSRNIISTTCLPLFNGVGHIELRGEGMTDGAIFVISSPVVDTLIRQLHVPTTTSINVTFNDREPTSIQWEITPLTDVPFSFSATAVFDSLFLQDSSELYNYDFDRITEEGVTYEPPYAVSNTIVLLTR
ncbi:MAG: hypothetical protein HQ556_01410 [Candidatus Marinimicrobia bacterium]|nr:hypothetical protein [Candidatus Neomarinimicrobiota bacterium]